MFFSQIFTNFHKFILIHDKDLNSLLVKNNKINHYIVINNNSLDNTKFTDLLIYWFILNYSLNFTILIKKNKFSLLNSYFFDNLVFFCFFNNNFSINFKVLSLFYEHLITFCNLIRINSNYPLILLKNKLFNTKFI